MTGFEHRSDICSVISMILPRFTFLTDIRSAIWQKQANSIMNFVNNGTDVQ